MFRRWLSQNQKARDSHYLRISGFAILCTVSVSGSHNGKVGLKLQFVTAMSVVSMTDEKRVHVELRGIQRRIGGLNWAFLNGVRPSALPLPVGR